MDSKRIYKPGLLKLNSDLLHAHPEMDQHSARLLLSPKKSILKTNSSFKHSMIFTNECSASDIQNLSPVFATKQIVEKI